MSYLFDEAVQSPMAMRFLANLEEVGVLLLLKKKPDGSTTGEIAAHLSLRSEILEPLCDFVALNLPGILEKKENRYILRRIPDALLNRLNFLLAYEPVFSNLPRLLRGEIRYGREVSRRSPYLQRSSALYSKAVWREITDFLQDGTFGPVVDLGCGSGDFLAHVVQTLPFLTGVGIEIDKETVLTARRAVIASGLAARIKILKGDVRTPENIMKIIRNEVGQDTSTRICIVGITLWHEFLIDGAIFLGDLLARYRTCFPGSAFVMVEYNGLSYEELASLPQPDRTRISLYHLIHPLTNQGSPQPPSFWQSILQLGGVRLIKTKTTDGNLTVYFGTFD